MAVSRNAWVAIGIASALNVALAAYSARAFSRANLAGVAPITAAPSTPATPAATTSAVAPAASVPATSRLKSLAPSLRQVPPMNGIDMAALDRFWESWRLVDVRYRQDNGEQRFVYANELAWNALKSNQRPYPDGAMFGKVAFVGVPDPAFPASVEPSTFARLQIMKKDTKAYKATDGWGYAVVTSNPSGRGTPAEDMQAAAACHACHRIVPDRDYVFSKSPYLPDFGNDPGLKPRFTPSTVQELTANEQKVLKRIAGKSGSDPLHYLPMGLFEGSTNEASVVLATYATDDHATYFLSDPQTGHFVIADGAEPDASCKPGTRLFFTRSSKIPGLVPDSVYSRLRCGDLLTQGHIDALDTLMSDKR